MGEEMKITFLGAARNVTGSCYCLEIGARKLLIDCGFYQERHLKERNWAPFAVEPASVDAVILTHAHLDHCGLLPKLVREGFSGNIYCTPATEDIARIILADSAKIQEHDAEYKKKRHEKADQQSPYPYEPLYTIEDAERVYPHFSTVKYNKICNPFDGVEVIFNDAGHILGSSIVEINVKTVDGKRKIIFSGDLGRGDVPILHDPSRFKEADYIVIESTYGNRVHRDDGEIPETLANIINRTVKEGGNIVVPSFAVERTQELLYHLHLLLKDKRIPKIPVIVDSPMAIKVTEVFERHPELFDDETRAMLRAGEHPCDFPSLIMSRTTEESKSINGRGGSAIIIAGSGMCTGGRIKHHIANNIGNPASTLLFVGYQAVGTLGRQLVEKEQKVRIHGQEYEVAAHVMKINGFSAHADRNELMAWLSFLERAPRRVFVTHGEPEAADSFAGFIQDEKGWAVTVPEYQQTCILE